ncbi:LamG domain-containing protein [Marinigracilibium pacificum]|uniref:LamG domain-containing protein n=1 Tax=Marinigracilibium pacificum TaxID=2729599 RepID=A0A848IYV1_9BACT|nr:LamG domain-containing protein [Marinigracilibium pacificum]NMM48455.1 LamG domain-containing protein [Marinigracilibium pacificum]
MRINLLSKGLLALMFISVISLVSSCTGGEDAEPAVKDIPRDGLVAFYPFNGNANDESNVGEAANLDIVGGSPQLTTDRFGNENSAYSFDGVNDYLYVNSVEKLNLPNGFSFAVWVKHGDNKGGAVFKTHGGQIKYFVDEVIGDLYSSPVFTIRDLVANTDGWNFMCFTFDVNSKSAKLYFNNEVISTGSLPSENSMYLPANNFVNIGNDSFNGIIDDVLIYNKALSNSEVEKIYLQNITK